MLSGLNNVQQLKLTNGDTVVANVAEMNVQNQSAMLQFPYTVTMEKRPSEDPNIEYTVYRLTPWFELGSANPITTVHFGHIIARANPDPRGLKLYMDEIEQLVKSMIPPELMQPQPDEEEGEEYAGLSTEEKKKLN